ncbi:hypothetical protein [Alkaliphilus transvaalensis]|uniref:hypothetical protein n=1 Tax=Alkaliphilus transvaalensis TaxID=114628 RepID=UPI00047E3BD3|nr:hypothetical protein [Alkaliphilus transvaalensis]
MKKYLSILMILTILLVGCSTTDSSSNSDDSLKGEYLELVKQVEEFNHQYGGNYALPLSPDYPILHVYLANPPLETMSPDMVIHYGLSKEELRPHFQDEAFIKSYEESTGRIIYGYYEGDMIAELSYYPQKHGEVSSKDVWVIDGRDIPYKVMNVEGEKLIITGINLEKGGYRIEYHISDLFGEDEAKELTRFFLKEIN